MLRRHIQLQARHGKGMSVSSCLSGKQIGYYQYHYVTSNSAWIQSVEYDVTFNHEPINSETLCKDER